MDLNTSVEQALILTSVEKLVSAVKVTLGAKGKTVLYNDTSGRDVQWDGRPYTTKDGFTVANQIKSKNDFEALVMSAIKAASKNTVLSSGDGTTSTMILTQALIEKGIELMHKQNMTSWDVVKMINHVTSDIVTLIKEQYAIPILQDDVLNLELLEKVASVSSNDKQIGAFIKNIYKSIGHTGTIEVQKSDMAETKVRMTAGMRLSKGFYNNTFTNDRLGSQFKANDAYVVVFDGAIRDYNQVMPFINMTNLGMQGKKPLLIFCDEVSSVAMSVIMDYVSTHNHPLCIIQNSQFGEKRVDLLNDIAGLTGGFVINGGTDYAKHHEYYTKSEDITKLPEYGILGRVKEVLVTPHATSLISSPEHIHTEYVTNTIDYLKERLSHEGIYKLDKKHWERRLGNLTGGIALVKVGGLTEIEMKELFFRYEDAVLAVKSAVEKGVAIGGGYTWVNIWQDLRNSFDPEESEYSTETYNELLGCLLEIPKQLLLNAGYTSNKEFKTYVNND
jgi:chaperonin GroEL